MRQALKAMTSRRLDESRAMSLFNQMRRDAINLQ
jgi:hypothetical protein